MTPKLRRRLQERQHRIQQRLDPKRQRHRSQPMFLDQNVHYDLADKTHGLHGAGLGVCQQLVQRLGLAQALNTRLHLFKRHFPYFESDHLLNLTYNFVVGGKNLQDLERLRNQEHYLDVLGARRIPDPTTAGDFLRRFTAADLDTLMDVINDKRLLVWQQQPAAFFDQAIIEGDGTLVATRGACKQGADMAYDGTWGYHPLLISLANTQEPLFVVNRSGNRPSHEGAAAYFDKAADLCRRAGFRQILFRGDTDFTQAAHLDRWQQAKIGFVFGIDAQPNLVERAQRLPERVWAELERPPGYQVKTKPRERPTNVKDEVVRRRGYRNVRLHSEQVAEFNYQPGPCRETYLIVVLRKRTALGAGRCRGGAGNTLLLLHHQPVDVDVCGGGAVRQRPWQPGEPGRATEERGAGLAGAGEHPGGEWGLDGAGSAGLESQGVAGVVAAGNDTRTAAAAAGVQGVPARSDAAALSDRACGGSFAVPAVAVESVGGAVVCGERAAATAALDLTRGNRHRGPDASIPWDAEPKKGPRAW